MKSLLYASYESAELDRKFKRDRLKECIRTFPHEYKEFQGTEAKAYTKSRALFSVPITHPQNSLIASVFPLKFALIFYRMLQQPQMFRTLAGFYTGGH